MKAKYCDYTTLTAGSVVWLDDPESIWQIQEGSVDVFAVLITPVGRQQTFLFEAGLGQVLFGLEPLLAGAEIRLMVTPAKQAKLKIMKKDALLHEAAQLRDHALESVWFMLEAWLQALLIDPAATPLPRNVIPLPAGQTVKATAGAAVCAGDYLVWAQVLSGEIGYGIVAGQEHKLTSGQMLPLANMTWLRAIADIELLGLTTQEVFPLALAAEPARFWQPLVHCHQMFSTLMLDYFADEVKRDNEQLQERRQLQEHLLSSAAVHLLRSDVEDLASPVLSTAAGGSPILAIMKMLASQLGIPEQQVRLPVGASPVSHDYTAIKNIARLAGMQPRLVKLEADWWLKDNGGLLGYYGEDKRPVALVPASPGKYILHDPAGLERVEVTKEIAAKLSHNAFIFYAGLPGKTVSTTQWFRFMLKKCWASDLWMIVLASLAAGIITMLAPLVTQTIFDDIIPINDRQSHVMVIQVMLVSAFATAGVNLTRGIAVLRAKNQAMVAVQAALWLRLLSLPTAFFRKYQAGDLANRMNGMTQVSMLVSGSAAATVFNLLFSFWSLFVMIYYSWKLTLAVVLVWLVYLVIAGLLAVRLMACKRNTTTASGKTAGRVLQIFNGLSKFRMQGGEPQAFYLWAKEFGEEWKWNRAARWKGNWLEFVNSVQPVILSMLVFWLTMLWLEAGDDASTTFMTQPEFLGFNAALTGLNAAIIGMLPVLINLLDIVPLMERIQPILQTEPEAVDAKLEAGALHGRIEINNVVFRYQSDRPPVLRNISLTVQPGQFAAIVGGSGSGKSTLLRLLLGFERPESGSVFFDGQDLTELNLASVRSQMGVVLQNGQLMSGDIFTNIVGSLPLTEDDAWQAAEMVGLAEDIRTMPMGIHTVISEGASNISGGQRQRILIARSIVNHPRILIFDEATSALDNRTQAIVTESIAKLKATRIVVAHRLSTIKNADVIYVMEKGHIIEKGTYSDLMEKNGVFAALAKRQIA
ncbi:NHLP bacteriocin export ABC transporter permease/ATPase subunit [Sporomusa malonica]|uniref:ABC transporter transmembrane region n=1 Tax=Sporomusa malonica TaxID=112901 RepID=A0A1W2CWB8_9FIRM|nr:NHLP bacteriocin export ABC transporter permease/ATPase subunit [Sporomusa malonica]SMC89537.1 ABC transporter transmembrane region [Sporomusa malonica]